MAKPLPSWATDLTPVDMDGAAVLLGISRRFLVDVIGQHKHYEQRGNRKVFYPEHIARLRYIANPPVATTPLDVIRNFIAPKVRDVVNIEALLGQNFDGQIYMIRCHERIKIGFTDNNWASRFRALKTSCPYPITIIAVMPGNRGLELFMHRCFKALRVHGEWFEERGDLATLIASIEALRG
jgi:hypothetical protein